MQRKLWIALAGICLAFSCSAPPQHVPEPEPELRDDSSNKGPEASGVLDEPPGCPLSICAGSACTTHDGTTSCKNALRLLGRDSLVTGPFERVVKGDLRCGATIAESGECPLAGGTVTFELDLRDASDEVDLIVELDAEFDPALRLEAESCVDPLLLACNLDHTEGVERAVLSERLSPGVYRLIAGAEELDGSGEFQLRVQARDAGARCTRAPANDTCATAIDLDPRRRVQTVVGTTHCAGDDAFSTWYCANYHAPDVFYRLDLRGEKGPTLLHASTDLAPTNFDTSLYVLEGSHGGCFGTLACNDNAYDASFADGASALTALLEPREYFLAVDGSWSAGDFGLRVVLEEPNCLDNDACDRALALDPALDSQTAPIDAACARSTRAAHTSEWDTPADVYYRLDLSRREGPTRLSVETDLESDIDDAYLVLFDAADGGECGREIYASGGWLEVVLHPGDYYLMVSPDRSGPQRGELSVELEAVELEELSPCIDEEVAACLMNFQSCCVPWTSGCSTWASICGLDPARFRCVCDQAPECCQGRAPGAGCAALFDSCGLLCEGLDSTAICEVSL